MGTILVEREVDRISVDIPDSSGSFSNPIFLFGRELVRVDTPANWIEAEISFQTRWDADDIWRDLYHFHHQITNSGTPGSPVFVVTAHLELETILCPPASSVISETSAFISLRDIRITSLVDQTAVKTIEIIIGET